MTVAALVVGAGRGERLRADLGAHLGAPSEADRGAHPRGGRGAAREDAAPGTGETPERPSGGASAAAASLAGEAPPKAFVHLAGRSLLAHACAALARCDAIDWVVPVVPAGAEALAREALRGVAPAAKLRPPVPGGAERQDSVAAGLDALPEGVALVAVHDAARPLLRREDVARVVAAAREGGAALLAVPAADTLHRVEEGRLTETPPREALWAAQTPQVFPVAWLREALAKARAEGLRGTDDAALVARLGHPVRVVEGHPSNRKITTAADLAFAEAWLARGGIPGGGGFETAASGGA